MTASMKTIEYLHSPFKLAEVKYNPFEILDEIKDLNFWRSLEYPSLKDCRVYIREAERYLNKRLRKELDPYVIDCIAYNLISLAGAKRLNELSFTNSGILYFQYKDFLNHYNIHKKFDTPLYFSKYKRTELKKYAQHYKNLSFLKHLCSVYGVDFLKPYDSIAEIIYKLQE
jgi:hypothetical protein